VPPIRPGGGVPGHPAAGPLTPAKERARRPTSGGERPARTLEMHTMTCTATSRTPASFLLLCLAALVILPGAATAQGLKIGIVKLDEILDGWTSVKKFEEEINAKMEQINQQIENLKTEVEELEKQIEEAMEVFDPESDEVQDLQAKRRKKLAELKATNDFNLVTLQRSVREKTLEFYSRVVAKIREYGQRNGYHLILKAEDDIVEADDQQTLRLKIAMRTVLHYNDQTLDITQAILSELNAE
jgi:Skp family chaperone for outer membrane proteins